jgi:predicted Zn-dependent protease
VLQADEGQIWQESRELEQHLDQSGLPYQEPALLAYLNTIAARLGQATPTGGKLQFTVKVIRSPLLNAFALPHGVIYIHTGLLAKLENEAQLATLLGHEMTHIVQRHVVKEWRHIENTTAVLASLGIIDSPMSGLGPASLLGAVGALTAISGYSQEKETEADQGALKLLLQGGYDPREALRLFQHIQRDLQEQKVKEPFFFATHPRVQERVDNFSQFLRGHAGSVSGKRGEEGFTERLLPLLLVNARLNLSAGRFKAAARDLERVLLLNPEEATANFLMGELHRQDQAAGGLTRAEQAYRRAIRSDASYPEPYKGLGLVLRKLGHHDEASKAFTEYLQRAPAAADKAYVEEYLRGR